MSMFTEIHTHGGYGINFNCASEDEVREFSDLIFKRGITGYCPTLATDTEENLKKQIKIIKNASLNSSGAKILGIHLEAIYLNPLKKGIHPEELLKKPSVEHYKSIEDDFIRIVTLAPELEGAKELMGYLRKKGVKIQAGHTIARDLSGVDGVTHLFNAMEGINHKEPTTATLALNEEVYVEVVADGFHVCDEVLKLAFRAKPLEKVILISDSLSIAGFEGDMVEFCSYEIYKKERNGADFGCCGVSKEGVLAGSAMFLDEIVKRVVRLGLLDEEAARFCANEVPLRFLNG